MASSGIHRLSAHGYDLAIDADNGASLVSLAWTMPNGRIFDILHPCPPATAARDGGCFVMAPFANRLDGGLFEFEGHTIRVPQNRPDDGLAIHGFSRDRQWQVLEEDRRRLRLVDRFAGDATGFAYRLVQTATIGADGVELSLALTNEAEIALPYGFGFHPWFRKEAETYVSFAASMAFGRDSRGFPQNPLSGNAEFAKGVNAASMPWFDGHFAGWEPRSVEVEWRLSGVAITLSATGALGNLHIYVPDDRPVLCIEPVSHVPDVHNRCEFIEFGDLTRLEPGETMTGAMRLSVRPMAKGPHT
jgi:aldose 1-epimerase